MNRKNGKRNTVFSKFLIVGLFIFACIFCLLMFLHNKSRYVNIFSSTPPNIIDESKSIKDKKDRTKEDDMKTNNALNEKEDSLEKIIKWVYIHSSKISRKQVCEIVKVVFNTSQHPLLTLAIIARESNFNPSAISSSKAIGLMQVLPIDDQIKSLKNAGIIKETRDLFDIETNIKAGEYILHEKLRKANGDIRKALYYYVGGDERYVTSVLSYVGELHLLRKSLATIHLAEKTNQSSKGGS